MRITRKFKILLALLIVLIVGIVIWDFGPAFNKRPGFEPFFKGSFNMTPNEIKRLYDVSPLEEKEDIIDFEYGLIYDTVIAGQPASLYYQFSKHGLLFKQYRLTAVSCNFLLEGFSIIESQELADKVIPLLIPAFDINPSNLHSYANENRYNKQYEWRLLGIFINKKLYCSVFGFNTDSLNYLSISFAPYKIINCPYDEYDYKEMNEFILGVIQEDRAKYGEFDYDKWRDIPAIVEHNALDNAE